MMEWDRFIREIGMIQKASHNNYFKPNQETRSEPEPEPSGVCFDLSVNRQQSS